MLKSSFIIMIIFMIPAAVDVNIIGDFVTIVILLSFIILTIIINCRHYRS